ncbi:MAG: non-canonical purine NTP pyrophosphatase, partial [Dehalococcoidales bacterium]|nr:non-canonical purine NTP pyrophosphatase [Dehalococcoidales bacterium]
LLSGIPFEILSPAEAGVESDVCEDGSTYEENAILKAATLAQRSQLLTLADDSGLEVDVLRGEPGIKSARFGGKGITDAQRNVILLDRLKGVPFEHRTARFQCTMAIAEPGGNVKTCNGSCDGIIALKPAGVLNFGYDPIFFLPSLNKTMAELPAEIKNQISHRAIAAGKARTLLERLYENSK